VQRVHASEKLLNGSLFRLNDVDVDAGDENEPNQWASEKDISTVRSRRIDNREQRDPAKNDAALITES
jgi:hypothetical protein